MDKGTQKERGKRPDLRDNKRQKKKRQPLTEIENFLLGLGAQQTSLMESASLEGCTSKTEA
jgi:hypothetical protein